MSNVQAGMLRPAGAHVTRCVKDFTNASSLLQLSLPGSSVSDGLLGHRPDRATSGGGGGATRAVLLTRTLAVVTDASAATPTPLKLAAGLVALQGVGLVGLAVVGVFNLASDRISAGASVSVFLAAYGAALLVCAWALTRRRGWARGPVLLTQLIQLGLAWNLRDSPEIAVPLALTAAVAIAAMLQPTAMEALLGEPEPD